MACVDQAPATAEYKLLQLKQCLLAGEALRAIEGLGHSAAAYHAAKKAGEKVRRSMPITGYLFRRDR